MYISKYSSAWGCPSPTTQPFTGTANNVYLLNIGLSSTERANASLHCLFMLGFMVIDKIENLFVEIVS
jgi:hypothetical protein